MALIRCAQCDAEISDRADACPRCGTPRPRECPNCQTESELGARYCAVCGISLSGRLAGPQIAIRQAQIRCPFCAEQILADAKKCRHCGEWLVGDTDQVSKPGRRSYELSDSHPAQHRGLRIAALILGIAGGVIGLFVGGFALTLGGIGTAFGTTGASTVVGGSVAALVCSVLGIVGGALALAKPKLAGWLMLIAAIGGTIGIFVAYFVAGPLLLIGSVLAFLGSRNTR